MQRDVQAQEAALGSLQRFNIPEEVRRCAIAIRRDRLKVGGVVQAAEVGTGADRERDIPDRVWSTEGEGQIISVDSLAIEGLHPVNRKARAARFAGRQTKRVFKQVRNSVAVSVSVRPDYRGIVFTREMQRGPIHKGHTALTCRNEFNAFISLDKSDVCQP